ncbi:MAG: hypothetical protein ACRD5J_14065, partial [Nitrososphaeraceae archaeon]
ENVLSSLLTTAHLSRRVIRKNLKNNLITSLQQSSKKKTYDYSHATAFSQLISSLLPLETVY